MKLVDFVAQEEGFRSKPYLDTEGVITFGHGLTYITEIESKQIMSIRLSAIHKKLRDKLSFFSKLTTPRRIVLCSMVYQLGFTGFMKFKKMLAALEAGDYVEAAKQGLDSKWALQTPERAKRQMGILSTSEEL